MSGLCGMLGFQKLQIKQNDIEERLFKILVKQLVFDKAGEKYLPLLSNLILTDDFLRLGLKKERVNSELMLINGLLLMD